MKQVVAVVILIIAVSAVKICVADSLSVSCGSSEGYAYYFEGGVVKSEDAGFTEDSIRDGKFTLTLNDQGEGDVLWLDATKNLQSASSSGVTVIVLGNDNGGANWLVMHNDGTVEVYSFSAPSLTAVSYKNSVGNPFIAKNSLMASKCQIQ